MVAFSFFLNSSVPVTLYRSADFREAFSYEPLARAVSRQLVPGFTVRQCLLRSIERLEPTAATLPNEQPFQMVWSVEMREAAA